MASSRTKREGSGKRMVKVSNWKEGSPEGTKQPSASFHIREEEGVQASEKGGRVGQAQKGRGLEGGGKKPWESRTSRGRGKRGKSDAIRKIRQANRGVVAEKKEGSRVCQGGAEELLRQEGERKVRERWAGRIVDPPGGKAQPVGMEKQSGG